MSEGGRTVQWSGAAYASQSAHHRSLDDWFLERLYPKTDDVVVDLGCGSGEFSARLAEIVTGGRVIGVEPDPSMLDTARRHDRPNLEFVEASAEQVDDVLEHASVDLVVSRAMLHWLPLSAYPRVLAAVRRVLKPGGWFHSESGGAGNVPKAVQLVEDLGVRFDVPAPPPTFPDAGLGFDLVEQAGFHIPVDGVRTVAQRRPFTREQLAGFLRTQATLVLTRTAPEDMAETIVQAALSKVDQIRRPDGSYDQTFVRLEILAQRPDT
jgi:SAM-dependent methyltransferase